MGSGRGRSRCYALCLLGLPATAWGFSAWQQSSPLHRLGSNTATRRVRMMMSTSGGAGVTSGDVLVIGGGLAGLSTALELSRRGAKVMVLSRDSAESASLAAGGMLAPQAERLDPGPYLDLCLQSRSMYPDWVASLEEVAGPGSFSTGFSASGGFLAPAFEGDGVFGWQPPPDAGPAYWLDRRQIRGMEPLISEEVAGGWWFPEDMQVDARLLYKTLREACVRSQVTILEGTDCTAEAIVFHPVYPAVKSVRLKDGRRLEVGKVVVAAGAWMNELLPIPVASCKGQMLSLRPPPGTPPPLSRVLFGDGCYIIPKTDGRIVVGATVEDGIMDRRVTARGIQELTAKAIGVCPGLADMEVEETWAGLRPTTPDFLPVLGGTPWSNLYVAGGYWRNGVLLAPRTAQLVADVVEGRVSEQDESLLEHFSWRRFLQPTSKSRVSTSKAAAAPLRAVASAAKPVPVVTPTASPPPPPSPQRTTESSGGTGDPYAGYKRTSTSWEDEEREAAALREARRKNREDAIQIGLEADPLGQEVGARFAVPSSPLSGEGSAFDEAAQRGMAAIEALPWTLDLKNQQHEHHDNNHHQAAYKQQGQESDYYYQPAVEEGEVMSIRAFAEMCGYDIDAPSQRPASSSTTPKGRRPPSEPDTYDDDYMEEVRPKVGWEVAKKMREEEEERNRQQQGGGAQKRKKKKEEDAVEDPYADLVKLREEENKKQVLREARRVNREGLVTFLVDGDDDQQQGGTESATKYSVATRSEWQKFDDLASQGFASGTSLRLDKENIGSPDGGVEVGKGETLQEQMARLGYSDETKDQPAAASTSSSSSSSSFRPATPKQQQQQQQQATPRKVVESDNAPRPPWAAEIEALYEKVRANQAEARRRKGLPVTGNEPPVIPFKTPAIDEEEMAALSDDERVELMEMFRLNPDGSLTKVERGKGLPMPWDPSQAGGDDEEEEVEVIGGISSASYQQQQVQQPPQLGRNSTSSSSKQRAPSFFY